MRNRSITIMVLLCLIGFFQYSTAQTIFDAAAKGDIVTVRKLIESDPALINCIDASKSSILHIAVLNNQKEIVELLLKNKADIETKNRFGRSPLLAGIIRGADTETLKLLIDRGADINTSDGGNNTPLEQANQRHREELVNLFIDKKVLIPDNQHKRMMMLNYAVLNGHKKFMEKLIELEVNIHLVNLSDGSLLHTAAQGGNKGVIEFFLKNGFDQNRKDRYGYTPLHYAVLSGVPEAVSVLIESGASLEAKSAIGKTPYHMALENSNSSIPRILKKSGADTTAYSFPKRTGNFFGENPPGDKPQIFAPEIISGLTYDHCVPSFSPDLNEVFWAQGYDKIMYSRKYKEGWSIPEQSPFSVNGKDCNVALSSDGKRIYFLSRRPLEGTVEDKFNIWCAERKGNGWSDPLPLNSAINKHNILMQFSLTKDNALYFGGSDIYKAEFNNGSFKEPVKLPEAINTNAEEFSPFIESAERFIIFTRCSDEGCFPFISIKDNNGTWKKAERLKNYINDIDEAFGYTISPDGKYFFFSNGQTSDMDVFWMDAKAVYKILEKFKD